MILATKKAYNFVRSRINETRDIASQLKGNISLGLALRLNGIKIPLRIIYSEINAEKVSLVIFAK